MSLDGITTLDFICRWALGLNFLFFGLNGFFHWRPIPPAREEMRKFVQAIEETGYLLTVVKVIEIVTGLCLLTGFFVPLALILLGPLVFVIVTSQLILNRGRGWGISLLILVPFAVLLATRWEYFKPFVGF